MAAVNGISYQVSDPSSVAQASLSTTSPANITDAKGLSDVYKKYPVRTSAGSSEKLVRILEIKNKYVRGRGYYFHFSMEVVNLDERPSYCTLSYVWGNQDNTITKAVCLDNVDTTLTLGKNCWSAIEHLLKNFGTLKIWIDAICINQNDTSEHSEKPGQLALMGYLYSRAETSYIWLGEGNLETDSAMVYLASACMPFYPFRNSKHRWIKICLLAYCLVYKVSAFRTKPHFKGLQQIMRMPEDTHGDAWINRLWTLQEALLPTNLIVVCGQKHIPWISLVFALEYMDFCHGSKITLTFPPSCLEWRRLTRLWQHMKPQSSSSHNFHDPALALEPNESFPSQLEEYRSLLNPAWKVAHFLFLAAHIAGLSLFMYALVEILLIWETPPVLPIPRDLQSLIAIFGFVLLEGVLAIVGVILITTRGSKLRAFRSVIPYSYADSILVEIQTRRATNLKDKYNGVLGIFHSKHIPTPQESFRRKKMCGAYQQLSRDLLEHTRSLNILLLTRSTDVTHSESCPVGQYCAGSYPLELERCLTCRVKSNCMSCTLQETCASCKKRQFCTACSGGTRCHDCMEIENCPACVRLEDCPSWVVDWRSSRDTWFKSCYWVRTGLYTALEKYKGATFAEKPEWEWHYDGLVVFGSIISTLTWSSGRIREVDQSSEPDTIRGIEVYQAASSDAQDALLFTTFTARFAEMCTGQPEPRGGQGRWTSIMFQKGAEPQEVLRGLQSDKLAWEFHVWMTDFLASEGLCLFRCEGSISVGPSVARKGDLLTLIHGVSTPVILRPFGDAYKIVGPASVSGLTDGEFQGQAEKGQFTLV